MAKLTDNLRNLFAQVTGGESAALAPTATAIDPTQNVYYTSFQLRPGQAGGVQQKLWEKFEADSQARVYRLNQARPACAPGFLGQGHSGAFARLPGMFDVLMVPFSAGELKSTGRPEYERIYVPGFLQRTAAALAVWRSSMRYVKEALALNDNYTLRLNATGMGAHYPDGSDGDTPLRMFSLQRFIEMMNRSELQNRILENMSSFVTDEAYHGQTPFYVLSNDLPNFPLPSVLPTEEEWKENWGAYKFFGRGGFIVDRGVAEGRRWIDGGHPVSIDACAAWCRGASTSAIPSGQPYCVAPISLDRPEIRGWGIKIDMVSMAPRYKLTVAPIPRGAWSQTVTAIAAAIEGGIRTLCDNDETAAKAAVALIAFTKLEGKSAQEAAAKAKTPAEKANAAALVARYNALAIELQLAVMGANMWCRANPEPVASLPATDLPAVEPPLNKKFNFDDIMNSIRTHGEYSLSPETAASPTRWSTAMLIGLGLASAAGGAIAYHRKHR